MAEHTYQKYGKIAFFLIGLFLVGWILLPFLRTILLSLVLGYAFYPLYRRLVMKIKSREISAIITVIIAVLCLIIPTIFVTNALISEASNSYSTIMDISKEYNINFDNINEIVRTKVGIEFDIRNTLKKGIDYVSNVATNFVTTVPAKILNFFILLFLMYYILKENRSIRIFIIKMLPFERKQKTHMLTQFASVVYGVVYGQLVTAIVQGALAGIGYWIFGVGTPILWAIITMIFALVPMFGTAIVWVPASLYLFFIGLTNGTWWMGVGLFLYGMLFVSVVDNFLRPILIAGKTRIHPALVLLGALGGLGVFGIIGIVIGPLVVAMFKQLLVSYQEKGR
jgi:predicted PurR-regulated permease PerM